MNLVLRWLQYHLTSTPFKEIVQWIYILQNVILDAGIIGSDFIEHQVFLDLYEGLQTEHVKPALDILNGKLGFYPKDYDKSETSEERNLRINRYYKKSNETKKEIIYSLK